MEVTCSPVGFCPGTRELETDSDVKLQITKDNGGTLGPHSTECSNTNPFVVYREVNEYQFDQRPHLDLTLSLFPSHPSCPDCRNFAALI